MSIALLASFDVKKELVDDFEKVIAELSAAVLAKEAGVSMYQLVRSQTDANHYRLIEVYADAAALAAHGQTEHFKALGPKLGVCLAAKPVIEKFDVVAR